LRTFCYLCRRDNSWRTVGHFFQDVSMRHSSALCLEALA
jgi:hypothetical protein